MATVVIAVGAGNRAFIAVGCINIVVAANAGGAFSPFGDITTLMVWQKGLVEFGQFFALVLPSVVNWLVPAAVMALAVPRTLPKALDETVTIKTGGWVIVALFGLTIALAVSTHNFFHLPPVLGMMTGLGLLKLYGFYLKRFADRDPAPESPPQAPRPAFRDQFRQHVQRFHSDGRRRKLQPRLGGSVGAAFAGPVDLTVTAPATRRRNPYDIFTAMQRAEWDTLMFFYGVILCVGGLGTIGYLALVSEAMYTGLGATWANILVGILSAIVDNIPVMFAVLTMNPDMSLGQWLLATLTAGVGGSLLSIGSAAGVALMGQARGIYTFSAHLKWAWVIALGYAASIAVHLLINSHLF